MRGREEYWMVRGTTREGKIWNEEHGEESINKYLTLPI